MGTGAEEPDLPDDGAAGASAEWKIETVNNYGVRTYVVTDGAGQQRYAHEDQLPGWAVKALGPGWLAEYAKGTDGYWTWGVSGFGKDDTGLAAIAEENIRSWQEATQKAPDDSGLIRGLRAAWRAPLEQRAALVADTASYAVRLLDSLQKEIAARSAIVQALAGEVAAAQTQAEHAAQLARMNEEQAAAVNAFLDRLLETRLGALERQARRREWILATVVALIIGVSAILVSHYLVGF
jgi:hypothetical protein